LHYHQLIVIFAIYLKIIYEASDSTQVPLFHAIGSVIHPDDAPRIISAEPKTPFFGH
jgi:hypothetical protein